MLQPFATLNPASDGNSAWTAFPTGSRYTTIDEGLTSVNLSDYMWATETEATQQIGLSAPTSQRISELRVLRWRFAYSGNVGTVDTPKLTLALYAQGNLVESQAYNADTEGSKILSFHDFNLDGLGAADAADLDIYFTYTPSGGEALDKPIEVQVLG